jgi:predicted transcriptional regulator of viral defense system
MRGSPKANKKTELAALSRAARGGVISAHTAAKALGLPPNAASARLSALSRAGWLGRIRRGVYAILPLESASEAETTVEDPWLLADSLFAPCYIGGWSAAEYWGLTEQLFRSTFVATASNIRDRSVTHVGASFTLVRVKPPRLRGVSSVWRGAARVHVSSRERTLVDAAMDPRWLGGFRHLAEVFAAYTVNSKADVASLLLELQRSRSGAAAKRVGFLAELMWPNATGLIEGALNLRSTGTIKLDPAIARRGRMNSRWGLWVNSELDIPTASTAPNVARLAK